MKINAKDCQSNEHPWSDTSIVVVGAVVTTFISNKKAHPDRVFFAAVTLSTALMWCSSTVIFTTVIFVDDQFHCSERIFNIGLNENITIFFQMGQFLLLTIESIGSQLEHMQPRRLLLPRYRHLSIDDNIPTFDYALWRNHGVSVFFDGRVNMVVHTGNHHIFSFYDLCFSTIYFQCKMSENDVWINSRLEN